MVLIGLVPLGTTTVRLGYHDNILGVPSKGTFLDVYTIKDKSQIFYFNLFLIVNIMNNYFTCFRKSKGSFYDTKTLIIVFYYLGGTAFCLEEFYVTCAQLGS